MLKEQFELISIIMAAFNSEKTIAYAINSVLNQTYSNFELLVIDDCSNDNTVEIVQGFAETDRRMRLITNKKNCGVSYTRKRGLKASKGTWIAILDSDDAWVPDKLEKQVLLQKKKGAEFIFTGSAFMSAEGQMIDCYLHAPEQVSYRQLLKQNVISNSSVLIQKHLYKEYYVEGDEMHEDFAIWLKILKEGRYAYGVDEPLIIYRLSDTSKSGNKLKAAKMNWNTYRYIGLSLPSAVYYECWYAIKGLLKYRKLKQH